MHYPDASAVPVAPAAGLETVDLRSDTTTHPTAQMYERMAAAPLGDDGLEGDPTVAALESLAAGMLGKPAAVYAPTATMANLLAVLAQAARQEQVVAEAGSHLYVIERGAAAITGTFFQGITGERGTMPLAQLQDALAPGPYRLRTALVCMETSHNSSGGAVLPLEHMRDVYGMARAAGALVHLDGARIFNAAVALGVPPAAIAASCDTVAICLSKGLSAPMGALLAGPAATIARARRLRGMLGGTQRQTGVVAAAGLVALETMTSRLGEDHARALALADGMSRIPGLAAVRPQTNIVQIDVSGTGRPAAWWRAELAQRQVLVLPQDGTRLRCVTHRHIDEAGIARALAALASITAT